VSTHRVARTALLAGAGLAVSTGAVLSAAIGGVAGLELFVAYAGMGVFLAVRRPRNPLGWLLALTGCGLALGNARVDADPTTLVSGTTNLGLAVVSWANSDGWALAFVGVIGIALLFPSGRLVPGRMAWVGWSIGAVALALAFLVAAGPSVKVTDVNGGNVSLPNPLAIAPDSGLWGAVPPLDLLYTALFAIVAAATAGLLARFRGASGIERLQYRWLVAAIVLVVITNGTWAALHFAFRGPYESYASAALVVAYPLVPVAIGIAVLRYRLYEIDRIISRTLGYAILTAILAGVFAGAVLGLQAVLRPITAESQVAVAASTLLVAALFGPIRRRVQAIVDRRFDRSRYDAARVADGFGARLRDRLELDAVSAELASTAHAALRPASVSVWVRERGRANDPAEFRNVQQTLPDASFRTPPS
jgi:hypothetical protein